MILLFLSLALESQTLQVVKGIDPRKSWRQIRNFIDVFSFELWTIFRLGGPIGDYIGFWGGPTK